MCRPAQCQGDYYNLKQFQLVIKSLTPAAVQHSVYNHVAWTTATHCFTACLITYAVGPVCTECHVIYFWLEPNDASTSHQCCASCTGFQSWRQESSTQPCTTRLITHNWFWKDLSASYIHLLTDSSLDHGRSTIFFGDRSFISATGVHELKTFGLRQPEQLI